MPDGSEPVDPNEKVYRRVFHTYYKPQKLPPLTESAFKPTASDTDGISLTRAAITPDPRAVAEGGTLGNTYYVAEMRAGDLMAADGGVTFKPDPTAEDPGHTVIPEMTFATIDTDEAEEWRNAARHVPCIIHGPFVGTKPRN